MSEQTTPSTAAYQKHRMDTLRGISHARVLETARELMKANQRKGKRYSKNTKRVLSGPKGRA